MSNNQNWTALRELEQIVRRNVAEFLGKPVKVDLIRDADGEVCLYMNWTADTKADGDDALFIKTKNPLSQEVTDNFIARTNTPGQIIPPAPLFEIHVQNSNDMLSKRNLVANECVFFIRGKLGRNAILCVHTGHPKLAGVFGEATTSAFQTVSKAVAAAGMIGGN
jgi:hypothetical protein